MDTDQTTNKIKITVQQLAEIAQEADMQDPIDWGMLSINEDEAFLMMAANVIEQMETVPTDQREYVAMATVTKLLVENFVLNLRLKGAENAKNEV